MQTKISENQNMEHVAVDLENNIWKTYCGNSTPPQFGYFNDEVTATVPQEAILGRTICYIVGAVVVHEGRVLMMRESKRSCRGKWYLPAGKVEGNESLEEAVVREVLEETGLHFEPSSIVCIDSQAMSWFRFTFVGAITGGKIKSLQEQDEESMEAGWFTPDEVSTSLIVRGQDVHPLISVGLKWYENHQKKAICRLMPVKNPHKHIIVRLVVVKRLQEGGKKSLHCVLSKNTANNSCPCFPYKVISNGYGANVIAVINGIMRDINDGIAFNTLGYLKVEHTGKPLRVADGLCLIVLVEIFIPVQNGILTDKYQWFELEENNLRDNIWELMESRGCVKLGLH